MEHRKICNVCGHIYCFTDEDIKKNDSNRLMAGLSGLATIANAISGTMYGAFESDKMADRALNKIVDFNKCPKCGSIDVKDLTEEELKDYKDGLSGNTGSSSITINTNASTESLIQRGMLYLEDGNWKTANAYFEAALDAEPTNANAYIGKMMVDLRIKTAEELATYAAPIDDNPNYIKAVRFTEGEDKEIVLGISKKIKDNILFKEKTDLYNKATKLYLSMDAGKIEEARKIFDRELSGFNNSEEMVNKCVEKEHHIASKLIKNLGDDERTLKNIENGLVILRNLHTYKGTKELIDEANEKCRVLKEQIEKKKEEERIKREAENSAKKKARRLAMICTIIAVAILIGLIIFITTIKPSMDYNSAVQSMEKGNYEEAIIAFDKLGDYKDSTTQQKECLYQYAIENVKSGNYTVAKDYFTELGYYKYSQKYAIYSDSLRYLNEKNYNDAYNLLVEIKGFNDTDDLLQALTPIPLSIETEDDYYAGVYTFTYDSQGKMKSATRVFGDGKYKWEYSFDDLGRVSQLKYEDELYPYVYNEDGTVERQMIKQVPVAHFDKYGVRARTYRTILSYDEHDNPLYENTTNHYDETGLLYQVNQDDSISYIEYGALYMPESYDSDLVWKNIRIIAGECIWN